MIQLAFFFLVCYAFSRFSTLKITYYFYILEKKNTSGKKKVQVEKIAER